MRLVARVHRAWLCPSSSSWIYPLRRGGDNRFSDDETGTHSSTSANRLFVKRPSAIGLRPSPFAFPWSWFLRHRSVSANGCCCLIAKIAWRRFGCLMHWRCWLLILASPCRACVRPTARPSARIPVQAAEPCDCFWWGWCVGCLDAFRLLEYQQ